MKFYENYFTPLSSKIDWCEPNYILLNFVAEFWNTISNLPFLIVAFVAINLNKGYLLHVPHSRYVNLVWVLLFLTGLGSVYFHATLSLFGQFCDEVGILWICFAVIAFFMLDRFLPKYFQSRRSLFQQIVLASAIVSALLGLVKPEINHFFLFLFVPPAFFIIATEIKRTYSPEFRSLGKNALVVWSIALTCWILDRIFCSFWMRIQFPYLHGIWHILVSVGAYEACICYAYSYALEQVPEKMPVLKFHQFVSRLRWCGLWYISFEENIV